MFQFKCNHCGAIIQTPTENIGKSIPCFSCQETVQVPLTGFSVGMVLGDFWLQKRLGTGLISDLFLAKRMSNDEKVVIKFLSPFFTRNPQAVENFMLEMCKGHEVKHPNLLTTFETGKLNGCFYLLRPYIEGDVLYHYLNEYGPMPEKDAVKIGLKIARILREVWQEFELTHQALTPTNILLGHNGEVYLLDFGNRKELLFQPPLDWKSWNHHTLVESCWSPSRLYPHYTPTPADDIYALGVLLYFMVTGKIPSLSGQSTPTQVLWERMNQTLQQTTLQKKPVKKNLSVSLGFASLLKKLLHPDSAYRLIKWNDVINHFKQFLKSQSVGMQTLASLNETQEDDFPTESNLTPIKNLHPTPPPFSISPPSPPLTKKERSLSPVWIVTATLISVVVILFLIGLMVYTHQKKEGSSVSSKVSHPPKPSISTSNPSSTQPSSFSSPVSNLLDSTEIRRRISQIIRNAQRDMGHLAQYREQLVDLKKKAQTDTYSSIDEAISKLDEMQKRLESVSTSLTQQISSKKKELEEHKKYAKNYQDFYFWGPFPRSMNTEEPILVDYIPAYLTESKKVTLYVHPNSENPLNIPNSPGYLITRPYAKKPESVDYINLREVFSEAKQQEFVYVYGAAIIYAIKATKVRLFLASDDRVVIWLNGKKIYSSNKLISWEEPETLVLSLKEGNNSFVFRSENHPGDWYVLFKMTQLDNLYPPDDASFLPIDVQHGVQP